MTKTIDLNENDPTMCFVKYFVKYIESAHGIDLLSFNKKNLSKEQKLKKVFNISKRSCSDMFSYVCFEAGYPKNMFSFHSLRSGSFVSQLFEATKTTVNSHLFSNLFQKARALGGWVNNSTAFKKYVRRVEIATLVCNRFVDPKNCAPLADEN
jgi:hypothetical protein